MAGLRKEFYFSERDILNGEFPNITYLNSKEKEIKGGGYRSLYVCRCEHCGSKFEISRKNLAIIGELRNTRQKRVNTTCETIIKNAYVLTPSIYIGQKFNHLTIKGFKDASETVSSESMAICECDCGRTKKSDGTPLMYSLSNIKNGIKKHCGCRTPKNKKPTVLKDSSTYASKERLYVVWMSMISRCTNPNKKEYPYYGGRGITVCKAWLDSYRVFRRWALKNGYDANAPRYSCTLDRIDNNRGYTPSNCRWVDARTQSRNKVDTIKYKYYSKTLNAREWSKELEIDYKEILDLFHKGLTVGQIIKKKRIEQASFKV